MSEEKSKYVFDGEYVRQSITKYDDRIELMKKFREVVINKTQEYMNAKVVRHWIFWKKTRLDDNSYSWSSSEGIFLTKLFVNENRRSNMYGNVDRMMWIRIPKTWTSPDMEKTYFTLDDYEFFKRVISYLEYWTPERITMITDMINHIDFTEDHPEQKFKELFNDINQGSDVFGLSVMNKGK